MRICLKILVIYMFEIIFKETAWCSIFCLHTNDSLSAVYIHCIKADVNVKL